MYKYTSMYSFPPLSLRIERVPHTKSPTRNNSWILYTSLSLPSFHHMSGTLDSRSGGEFGGVLVIVVLGRGTECCIVGVVLAWW